MARGRERHPVARDFGGDPHWNMAAYRLAAEAAAEQLEAAFADRLR